MRPTRASPTSSESMTTNETSSAPATPVMRAEPHRPRAVFLWDVLQPLDVVRVAAGVGVTVDLGGDGRGRQHRETCEKRKRDDRTRHLEIIPHSARAGTPPFPARRRPRSAR